MSARLVAEEGGELAVRTADDPPGCVAAVHLPAPRPVERGTPTRYDRWNSRAASARTIPARPWVTAAQRRPVRRVGKPGVGQLHGGLLHRPRREQPDHDRLGVFAGAAGPDVGDLREVPFREGGERRALRGVGETGHAASVTALGSA